MQIIALDVFMIYIIHAVKLLDFFLRPIGLHNETTFTLEFKKNKIVLHFLQNMQLWDGPWLAETI